MACAISHTDAGSLALKIWMATISASARSSNEITCAGARAADGQPFAGKYVAALERDWSPDNVRGPLAAKEELEQIRQDPERFIQRLTDREAKGPPVALPDGSSFRVSPAIGCGYGGHDALRFRIRL